MGRWNIAKRILGCAVAAGLTVLALGAAAGMLQRKDSNFKYRPYFTQEADFDVLFFGTSHVINGIFPMELWKDYGIVSYNFGGHGNELATSYWVMRNALDYTDPKLVVIDGLKLGSDVKTYANFSNIHQSLDAFPISRTKIAAASDLLDDPVMDENIAAGLVGDAAQRTKMSLLWDFTIYHSRWNGLGQADFASDCTKEKGAESRIAVSVPDEIPYVPADEKLEGETAGTRYLRRMIKECQSRGIQVLLTYLPFPSTKEQQQEANRIGELALAYDVEYINFLDMDLVDYDTDCYDPNSHLNPSGARKVTDFLGSYIMEHYKVADQRTHKAYEDWHKDYEAYQTFKEENLKQQGTADVYLMLLADKNYNALIEIKDPALWESDYYNAFFENLGIDTVKAAAADADCLFVKGGSQADDLSTADQKARTEYGTFVYKKLPAQEGFSMNLNQTELYRINTEQAESEAMHISVFEKDTMRLVDHAGFAVSDTNENTHINLNKIQN